MIVKRKLVGVGVVLVVVLVCAVQSATAATGRHLSGGGTASISQVAFNVSVDGSGGASGSFECLMAGRSSSALGAFRLSHIMQVRVTPTAGSISGSTVVFSGPGELIMDGLLAIAARPENVPTMRHGFGASISQGFAPFGLHPVPGTRDQ